MATPGNEPAADEPTADPSGEAKQHGDPLLSTTHGEPEEGSRQGEAPPAVSEDDPRN
jgi:hypothetical protein